MPFGPAHEWCDRICERCPLAPSCAVAVRQRGRRWAHQMRGRDPDDSEVALGDVAHDLSLALAQLEEIQAELGTPGAGPDAPAPPRPELAPVVSLVGRRLDDGARELIESISRLGVEDDPLLPPALTLSMKAARVGSYLSFGTLDEVWEHDGAPNVLLLDHLRRALRAELARIGDDGCDRSTVHRALERFEHALDPLVARAEPQRAHLDALIAAGQAPSPFVTSSAPERAAR